jgi:hypothetical protein
LTFPIDVKSNGKEWVMSLAGHSSPSGEDGSLYPETDTLTTAKDIVYSITVSIE